MTYTIKYKEYGREWSSTSYMTPETVTEDFLIEFLACTNVRTISLSKRTIKPTEQYGRRKNYH